MAKEQGPEVKTFLFCEEVRQEKSNKYIILGVYAGGLTARELPAQVPLAFYIEILSMPLGRMNMSLRISGPGEGKFEIPIVADTQSLGKTFVLATPRLEVTLECEGDLLVEIKFEDGNYYEIGRMSVETDATIWSPFSIEPQPQGEQSPLDDQESVFPSEPSPPPRGKKRARL